MVVPILFYCMKFSSLSSLGLTFGMCGASRLSPVVGPDGGQLGVISVKGMRFLVDITQITI